MILKINQFSLDSIYGVLFITVISSLIILPQALGFSKGISLFQLKSVSAGNRSMDEDNDSTTSNEKMVELSISKQRRMRFLASLPQLKLQHNKLYFGDETDRDIIKTTVPNMLYYIVVPIVASVDTFWVGRLGVALALAGQGE